MDLFDKFQFNDYVKKTLNNIHFTSPTPIQDKVIPLVYKNKDIIGISQTGTGKTHSFLIPIIDRIDIFKSSKESLQSLYFIIL